MPFPWLVSGLFARNQRKLCCDKFTAAANQPPPRWMDQRTWWTEDSTLGRTKQLPRDTSQLTVEFNWKLGRYRPLSTTAVLMHSPPQHAGRPASESASTTAAERIPTQEAAVQIHHHSGWMHYCRCRRP